MFNLLFEIHHFIVQQFRVFEAGLNRIETAQNFPENGAFAR